MSFPNLYALHSPIWEIKAVHSMISKGPYSLSFWVLWLSLTVGGLKPNPVPDVRQTRPVTPRRRVEVYAGVAAEWPGYLQQA